MYYEVAYSKIGGRREFEIFKSKKRAETFAKNVLSNGCSDVFVDTYDNENDLKESQMYTVHGVMNI